MSIQLENKGFSGVISQLLSPSGTLKIGGTGNTNNESLSFDFESVSNKVTISSLTSVDTIEIDSSISLKSSVIDVISSFHLSSSDRRIKIGYGESTNYQHGIIWFSDGDTSFRMGEGDHPSMLVMRENMLGIDVVPQNNKLEVNGAQVIGSGYAGVETAPTDGLLVEGDIGVGVTNPYVPLQVNGIISADKMNLHKVGNQDTFIEAGDGELGAILFSMERTPSGAPYANEIAIKAEYGPLSFWDGASGTATRRMMIYNGNVGIGTTTPTYLLDTAEIGNSDGVLNIQPDSEGDVYIFAGTNVGNTTNGKKFNIYRKASEGDVALSFYVDQYKGAIITPSSGASKFYLNTASVDTVFAQSSSSLSIQYNANGGTSYFYGSSAGENNSISIYGYLSDIAGVNGGSLKIDDVTDSFKISTSADTDAIYLANNVWAEDSLVVGNGYVAVETAPTNGMIVEGNIGIGTATPSDALEVAGSGHKILLTDSGDSEQPRITLGHVDGFGGYITGNSDNNSMNVLIRTYASSGVQGYFNIGNMGFKTDSPVSTVDVNGSFGTKYTTITSTTYTADEETTILVDDDTAGSTVTITLPQASTVSRRIYNIKKLGTTANVIIDGNASETIDGSLTQTLSSQYESITILCDGNNWFIL